MLDIIDEELGGEEAELASPSCAAATPSCRPGDTVNVRVKCDAPRPCTGCTSCRNGTPITPTGVFADSYVGTANPAVSSSGWISPISRYHERDE